MTRAVQAVLAEALRLDLQARAELAAEMAFVVPQAPCSSATPSSTGLRRHAGLKAPTGRTGGGPFPGPHRGSLPPTPYGSSPFSSMYTRRSAIPR